MTRTWWIVACRVADLAGRVPGPTFGAVMAGGLDRGSATLAGRAEAVWTNGLTASRPGPGVSETRLPRRPL